MVRNKALKPKTPNPLFSRDNQALKDYDKVLDKKKKGATQEVIWRTVRSETSNVIGKISAPYILDNDDRYKNNM